MNMNMPELEKVLIDCLKIDDTQINSTRLAALSSDSWQLLLRLAAEQRVKSLFWHRLKEKGLADIVPPNVTDELNVGMRQNIINNLRRYGELRKLISRLDAEGIPLIALKGIFLADTVYENIGLREMNDIDVLARSEDLTKISDILVGIGYSPLHPISAKVTLQTCHHMPPLIKAGYAKFEIHWNLMGLDESGYIAPAVFWERAMPVQVQGCKALALSPTDLLLHICYHTSYHHRFAFGLRPSCDIAATISHFGAQLDWQYIVERAISNGWQRGVYLALHLAKELAGADVPAAHLECLHSPEMTDSIREVTRCQIFSDKTVSSKISASFAELLESKSIFDKLRIFLQRVFIPKTMIAARYPVPIDSLRIYVFYLYRIFDLLRRHRHSVKKYQENDVQLMGIVERTNIINDWLGRQR